MKKVIGNVYYFLPVQLLLLHFRKYQLLLLFWLILLLTVTGNFASHFGASSLFLAPEYLGHISAASMFLMGGAMCVFTMTWHITTFIIHSKRMPYMGATRHSFLVYSLNNSIIPVAFLAFYSIVLVHYQWYDERASVRTIILQQLAFYVGFAFIALISFAYFFRVSRDFFKSLLSHITNPSRIREIIPYDSLDYEVDIIPARSYLSGSLRVRKSTDLPPYQPRVMATVLRRHHRNVIFAAFVSYVILLLMGIFMDQPLLRIPAGAGFLLLFSIILGLAGAFKYFLKSWEAIAVVLFVLLLSFLVRHNFFDLRSIAYGLNYHQTLQKPIYDYEHLHELFTAQKFNADKETEEKRLDTWKAQNGDAEPPLIVITVSGGGSRSAYWTFRSLQYADSVTHGKLFRNTVMMTGASGGMIGAAYWRSIHDAYAQGKLKDPYAPRFQENAGKDLLNAIIFSLASVDLISPFNKISIGGYNYTRDRGYAMEQELVTNSEGLLDKNIGYFGPREQAGVIPMMVINGTIVNDGRKLMMGNEPLAYLTQESSTLNEKAPPIDAVDFAEFFKNEDPYNLRLTSAIRMNATFPVVLPVVKLPSAPEMNVMDAGLRDNFGTELAIRYINVLHEWMEKNTRKVIVLTIRDTRANDVSKSEDERSLEQMLIDPMFVIENKWESFQSYSHGYLEDYPFCYPDGKLRLISMQYVPKESKKVAALNFHLTQDEKDDIYQSIGDSSNIQAIDTLISLLR